MKPMSLCAFIFEKMPPMETIPINTKQVLTFQQVLHARE
jgi:hypothetical protein